MTEWNPYAEPVDRFFIGGHMTPGIAELVAPDSPRKWEEREGPGWSGAVLVFRGIRPSHFAIKFRLYGEIDYADWTAFHTTVARPPYGKRPRALDIRHPLLEPLGITAIVVENVVAPQQVEDGVWEAELKVIEYRRLKYSYARPEGSQAEPLDPVELEIEAARQEAHDKAELLAEP